jgi:DNA-binding response OmpR family regulator
MDMLLPIMSGQEATQRIRALESHQHDERSSCTKILALTASAFVEEQEEILTAGCYGLICKPYRVEEILEKIACHIKGEYLYESPPELPVQLEHIRFLSNFLLEQSYQVRKAISGQIAFTAIKALIPNVILLDVNMPDISGYEICCQLKECPSTASIPIIFLSASNEAIDKVKAFQLGAADYITKPFYLEEVLVKIKTQLTIQELKEQLEEQNQQLNRALEALKRVMPQE